MAYCGSFHVEGDSVIHRIENSLFPEWIGTDLMRTFEGRWVYSVTFLPDGIRILSGGGDNVIKLWDAATGARAMAQSW